MSDNWDFFFCQVDKEPASIFVDLGLAEEAPLEALTELVWLRVRMNSPREDGLSSSDEYARLMELEDAILESLPACEQPLQMVGRNTNAGVRDFYFYSANGTLAESHLSQVMVPFGEYEFETGTRPDSEWETYFGFLLPDERSYQDISNRRVLTQLEDAGDQSTKPRDVDHCIVFDSSESRSKYAGEAVKLGYTIMDREDSEEEQTEFVLHLMKHHSADYETISQIVMELYDLALEYDAIYDGWGCPIVK